MLHNNDRFQTNKNTTKEKVLKYSDSHQQIDYKVPISVVFILVYIDSGREFIVLYSLHVEMLIKEKLGFAGKDCIQTW